MNTKVLSMISLAALGLVGCQKAVPPQNPTPAQAVVPPPAAEIAVPPVPAGIPSDSTHTAVNEQPIPVEPSPVSVPPTQENAVPALSGHQIYFNVAQHVAANFENNVLVYSHRSQHEAACRYLTTIGAQLRLALYTTATQIRDVTAAQEIVEFSSTYARLAQDYCIRDAQGADTKHNGAYFSGYVPTVQRANQDFMTYLQSQPAALTFPVTQGGVLQIALSETSRAVADAIRHNQDHRSNMIAGFVSVGLAIPAIVALPITLGAAGATGALGWAPGAYDGWGRWVGSNIVHLNGNWLPGIIAASAAAIPGIAGATYGGIQLSSKRHMDACQSAHQAKGSIDILASLVRTEPSWNTALARTMDTDPIQQKINLGTDCSYWHPVRNANRLTEAQVRIQAVLERAGSATASAPQTVR